MSNDEGTPQGRTTAERSYDLDQPLPAEGITLHGGDRLVMAMRPGRVPPGLGPSARWADNLVLMGELTDAGEDEDGRAFVCLDDGEPVALTDVRHLVILADDAP